jgi:hypothetical protein
MSPKFTIPQRLQSHLHYAPCANIRTDAEIIRSLQSHKPITDEKNIWAYWHAGIANMPDWCQRNVASWVRMHDASWTVRVLDNKPDSPTYVLNTLPASQLPDCFVKGTMDGPYVAQHSADLVRGLALARYGGVWLDVGCMLFMNLDWICWNAITNPKTPFRAAVPLIIGATIANSFLACRKDDPFILRWHDLFTEIWKGRTNSDGLLKHPLLAYEQDQETKQAFDAAIAAGFKVSRETVQEYLIQVICWERLTLLGDRDDGFNPCQYWQNCIMKLQASKEIWGMEEYLPTGAGAEQLELLTTRLDDNSSSEQHQKAEDFVFRLLTNSCMEKIGHGPGLTKAKSLGVVLDEDISRIKDAGEGTFAELLRYGAENFVQTREGPVLFAALTPTSKIGEGLLEV